MRPYLLLAAALTLGAAVLARAAAAAPSSRPNVILIITDDQGYGDLGAHGNRMIRTPHLDRLHGESVRLTNFHVDPTCAPSRAALMTGRYSTRTGVWHTIAGRSLMAPDEVTLAQSFNDSGYRTGIFGKWHLGDNYPLRPHDRGFDVALTHGGGGVTQTPDHWGNDYFDDTYARNGKPEKLAGYCTDVWFREASRFVEANQRRSFFLYLSTNAPHSPYNVAASYADPYRTRGVPDPMAAFYGMITNIDENIGVLRDRLRELKLDRNTIFIFMTDNGTAAGVARAPEAGKWPGFSAGMRAAKGSEYEGGHRVPCFFYWPEGNLTGGFDIPQLTAHIDLLPTLAQLCSLTPPKRNLDGVSLAPLLRREKVKWADRTLFVHSQRVQEPVKWKQTAVMTPRWRLVNGKELYDIPADPGQQANVAAQHPDVMSSLTVAYDRWWDSLEPARRQSVPLTLGHPAQNPVTLNAHDWRAADRQVPWNHEMIARQPAVNGWWAVEIARPGEYEFTLRAWPPERSDAPVLPATSCRLAIGPHDQTLPIPEGARQVTVRMKLPAGPTKLQSWLKRPDGQEQGAYYVTARRR
ncbi:MAG: arylsulfatase [Actinomycetota bacterium]